MNDNLTPHTVIEGEEHLLEDENGDTWAGKWQLDKMDNRDKINIGHFDDPVRGPRRPAGLPHERLFKHLMITGTTGYGKSTCLRNIMYQLIDDGHGMCFIDPKGYDSGALLRQIPSHRTDDVVWVEPEGNDGENVIGFNILETEADEEDPRYEHEIMNVSEDFLAMLRDTTSHWGPTIDNVAKVIIEQLVRDDESYSIIDFTRILTEEEEMENFIQKYRDNLRKSFMSNVEKLDDTEKDPVLRRLRNWISSRPIRQMIANGESNVTISEIVREGKILILNTSNIEQQQARKITTQTIISRVWSSIKTRGEIPQDKRDPYYLCIDEFDKIATERFSINDIISMARSFKLGVICAFQQYSQLPKNARMVSKSVKNISLNPGNNKSDASSVAQIHRVGSKRMQNLQPNEAVMNPVTEDGFESEDAFDVSLFAEIPPKRTSEDIINSSLEKYGVDPSIGTDSEDYGIDSTE